MIVLHSWREVSRPVLNLAIFHLSVNAVVEVHRAELLDSYEFPVAVQSVLVLIEYLNFFS